MQLGHVPILIIPFLGKKQTFSSKLAYPLPYTPFEHSLLAMLLTILP